MTAIATCQLTRKQAGVCKKKQANGFVSTAKSWCNVRLGRAQKVIVDFLGSSRWTLQEHGRTSGHSMSASPVDMTLIIFLHLIIIET